MTMLHTLFRRAVNAQRPLQSVQATTPVVLQASQLKSVVGAGPNGTWKTTMSAMGPNGTW